MANRGTKRRCSDCGAAFYDLGRTPIVCPKCGTTHEPQVLLKSDGRQPRKSRNLPPPPAPVVEAEPAPESDEEALPDEVADDEEEADEPEIEEPVEGDEEVDRPDNSRERES